jgi:amino acid transporter
VVNQTNSFGYREELRRSMGRFSSFAVSFSLISVLTGLFANFDFGLRQAGGDIVWTWLLVAAGQTLVALVMANLSIRFPIAGYGYQWASRLANPDFGFFVGWLLLMQFLTGIPGICQTFVVALSGMAGVQTSSALLVGGTVAVISLVTLIHLFGIKAASRVNDLGVYAEIAGILFLILALAFFWILSGEVLPENLVIATQATGDGVSRLSGLTLSLLLGAWCLTGFEAAADLSEETKSPTTSVPRAVMSSHVAASLSGFLILVLLVANAGRIAPGPDTGNTLLRILEATMGPRLGAFVILFVIVSVFACAVAAMATASRLLFSMARDRILPFSGWIAKVDESSQTPRNAVWLVWGFSTASILFFRRIEMVTNVSALASYLGYAGIMAAALRGGQAEGKSFLYSQGWERPIQWLALSWTLSMVLALSVPETQVEGFETLHLPALSTGVALFAGALIYILYVRDRIGDGRAGPPQPSNP